MNNNQSKIILNIKLGSAFPPAAKVGGYLFLTMGIIAFLTGNIFIGPTIGFLGAFVCFTFSGIKIDIENKKIKSYFSCIGFTSGKWEDISLYPDIAILKNNKTYVTYSRANVSTSYQDSSFDIYLLNETHRKKILIKSVANSKIANEDAVELAGLLGKKIVQYSPVVYSGTRRR